MPTTIFLVPNEERRRAMMTVAVRLGSPNPLNHMAECLVASFCTAWSALVYPRPSARAHGSAQIAAMGS